jgi:hypothetical protein
VELNSQSHLWCSETITRSGDLGGEVRVPIFVSRRGLPELNLDDEVPNITEVGSKLVQSQIKQRCRKSVIDLSTTSGMAYI